MKSPEQKTPCPDCGSADTIKKGNRKNKNTAVPLFLCKECGKRFSRQIIKNKTYDIKTIVKALSMYNSGLTIDAVTEKTGIPGSTISNWHREFKTLFNLYGYNKEIRSFSKNNRIIEKRKYNHGQIYLYQQSSFKIERFVRDNEKGIYEYLESVKNGVLEDDIFINSSARASAVRLNIIQSLNIKKTNNNACKFAHMVSGLAGNNSERHGRLEKLMLENDTSTIAVEVPVFLQLSISTIPWLKNIKSANDYITGHIDFLQYRNGKLYILDYKPDAQKEKPFGQLFVYACCLSRLTGISFNRIMLAWFDEYLYCEFGAMDAYKTVMRM